jgi:hypothetical protein
MKFIPNVRRRGHVVYDNGGVQVGRTKQFKLWDMLMEQKRKNDLNWVQAVQGRAPFRAPVIQGRGAYRMRKRRFMRGGGRRYSYKYVPRSYALQWQGLLRRMRVAGALRSPVQTRSQGRKK